MWTLDAKKGPHYQFSARFKGGLVARPLVAREENWEGQPLKRNSDRRGRQPPELPAGYSLENWEAPLDLYGRNQLFEPTGIAVAKDGTIVVSTRTAGVWRIRDDKWTLFAEGIYEGLGVVIEDDKGDRIVVMQKPELTRMSDTNGDGRADTFETVCDDYGFHGNYHEYTHGPVRDAEGNYYFTLNLSHGGNERTSWRAGGPLHGIDGRLPRLGLPGHSGREVRALREWSAQSGGLGFDPDGRLWYAENQGEYVGSSKVVPLEKGKFYGHLSGLVTLPGEMKPDSPELKFDHWKDKIRKGAVWLPHGKLANSPGNPAWDTTGGKFGAYEKQMFIGDQTLSTLLRVVTEQVKGSDQGCVIPFARGLASGVMRPCFLPDGSLLIGQTGRGWGAQGGQQAELTTDRLRRKDGRRRHPSHQRREERFLGPLHAAGFRLCDGRGIGEGLKVQSWFYTNTGQYGSPEHDKRDDAVEKVILDADRKIRARGGARLWGGRQVADRIYYINFPETKQLFGDAPVWGKLESYFTLRAIP